jgi:hypothetical protein
MYYIFAENRVVHATSKHDAQDTVANTNHAEPELSELRQISANEVIPTLGHLYNKYFTLFCSKRAGAVRADIKDHAKKHADIIWG